MEYLFWEKLPESATRFATETALDTNLELSMGILKGRQMKMNRRDEGWAMLFGLVFFATLGAAGLWIASIDIPTANDPALSSDHVYDSYDIQRPLPK